MRESAAFVTTTSLRTSRSATTPPSRSAARAASCALRSAPRRRAPTRASRRARRSAISVRKPRLPKLTPRIGTVVARLRDAAGHAEQRAVAAEDDDEVARARQILARRASAVGGRPRARAVSVSKTGVDAAASSQPATSASTLAAASRSRLATSPTGEWRLVMRPASCRCRRNSRLPSVPVMGDSHSPARLNPTASARRRPRRRRARAPRGRARCRPCRPRRARLRTAASRARRRRPPGAEQRRHDAAGCGAAR